MGIQLGVGVFDRHNFSAFSTIFPHELEIQSKSSFGRFTWAHLERFTKQQCRLKDTFSAQHEAPDKITCATIYLYSPKKKTEFLDAKNAKENGNPPKISPRSIRIRGVGTPHLKLYATLSGSNCRI